MRSFGDQSFSHLLELGHCFRAGMADPTAEIPPGTLARMLELSEICRRRVTERPDLVLLRWPSQQAIGVASVKALSLNTEALCILARFWTTHCKFPKAVPIDLLRAEAAC